jgi:hypothetical protein
MFMNFQLLNGNKFKLFTVTKFVPYTLFYQGKWV